MGNWRWAFVSILMLVSFGVRLSAQQFTTWNDPSPHTVQFVTVEENVKLEVLDWGGSGRPIVLLGGSGDTAHVFDDFAPKFIPLYHVYGITRRGFGASSHPEAGYTDQRLADDVLAVLNSLKIPNPVLVGHSMAGSEMTTLGVQHSDRLAGLVYLTLGTIRATSQGRIQRIRRCLRSYQRSRLPRLPRRTRNHFKRLRASF